MEKMPSNCAQKLVMKGLEVHPSGREGVIITGLKAENLRMPSEDILLICQYI